MKKIYLLLISVLASVSGIFAQPGCSSAIAICGNTQSYCPNGVGTHLEQLACGSIEHNSLWFVFQARANGKLNFVLRPTTPAGVYTVIDVDWNLWQLPGAPGVSNCNRKTQLSCNFGGLLYGSVIPMNGQSLPGGTYPLRVYNIQENASFRFVIQH